MYTFIHAEVKINIVFILHKELHINIFNCWPKTCFTIFFKILYVKRRCSILYNREEGGGRRSTIVVVLSMLKLQFFTLGYSAFLKLININFVQCYRLILFHEEEFPRREGLLGFRPPFTSFPITSRYARNSLMISITSLLKNMKRIHWWTPSAFKLTKM